MVSKRLRNIIIVILFISFVFLNIFDFESTDNNISSRMLYRIVELFSSVLLNILMIIIDESLEITQKIYKNFSTNKFFNSFVCLTYIVSLMIVIGLICIFDEGTILYNLFSWVFLAVSALGVSIAYSLSKLNDSTNNNQNNDR